MFRTIALLMVMTLPAFAQEEIGDSVGLGWYLDVRSCGNPCRITNQPGGNVELHKWQAQIARDQNIKIVIDGKCNSACTIMVDRARPNVCVTPNAVLGFHQAYTFDMSKKYLGREDIIGEYSAPMQRWIKANGGLPTEGLIYMRYDEARKIFPACRLRQTFNGYEIVRVGR